LQTAGEDLRLTAERLRLLDLLRLQVDRQAPVFVADFFRRALTVPDRQMRSLALVRRLRRIDAHLCFALLEGLLDRAARKLGHAQELLLDLTAARPLVDALGYLKARRVYELAGEHDRGDVARMLLSPESPAHRSVASSFLAKQNEKMPDQSLGWRKKLARGTDRMKLDRLLFDRNPQVVRLLMDNPRVIERDVIRIAAMRPTNPANLAEVFRHPRWVKRYRIKVALACNPWTPVDIALSCVPHLMLPQLQYVANSAKIDASVRQAAVGLLELRRQPLDQPEEAVLVVEPTGELVPEAQSSGSEEEIDVDGIARQLEDWMAWSADRFGA
jgi:hypothetical protein